MTSSIYRPGFAGGAVGGPSGNGSSTSRTENLSPTTFRHRVACIDRDVEHSGFELADIDTRGTLIAAQIKFQVNVLWNGVLDQKAGPLQHAVDVHGLRVEHVPSGECQ